MVLGADTEAAHRRWVILDREMLRKRGFKYEVKTFFSGINLDELLKPDAKVLELGCGYGDILRGLKKGFDIEAHGLDLERYKSLLDYIQFWRREKIQFLRGDIESLPYREGTFDFIFSYKSFLYVPDKLKGLTQAHRVLKKGGIAIIDLEEVNGNGPNISPPIETIIANYPNECQVAVEKIHTNRLHQLMGHILNRVTIHKKSDAPLDFPKVLIAHTSDSPFAYTPDIFTTYQS